MPLASGQSELDTVALRLPNTSTEIKNWQHYRITSRFLVPCDQFEFTIAEEDLPASLELLAPGAPVEIAINDRLVLTGAIDKRTVAASRSGGTTVQVTGRDILGPVVSSNIDPKFVFSDSLTVLDVAAAVLSQFGITTIYNDGDLNISAQTGAAKKSKPSSESVSVQLPKLELQADGSISTSFQPVSVKQVITGRKKSLKSRKLQQLKPHIGEGAYEYMARVCKRFGLHVYAAADGSGVVIDEADFSGPTHYTLRHTRTGDSNVIDGRVEVDLDSQPSCVVAMSGAQSPSASEAKVASVVIMVNELVGTDGDGAPLTEVQNIIARYNGAKVLPLRSELLPRRKAFNAQLIARPVFIKDDESRTVEHLEAFARRKMAELQHRALHASYTIEGHTQNGVPWTTNTMASVQDEVLGVDEPLWLLERTFEKSRAAGTVTHVTFVRPLTIALN